MFYDRVMELETTLQTMEHLVNDLKSAKGIYQS